MFLRGSLSFSSASRDKGFSLLKVSARVHFVVRIAALSGYGNGAYGFDGLTYLMVCERESPTLNLSRVPKKVSIGVRG